MKTVKIIFLSTLVYTLLTAVVLSSVHARDVLASSHDTSAVDAVRTVAARAHNDDSSSKVIGELHNHVDKTFVKVISDQATLIRQRQTQENLDDIDRPLSVLIMEALLMFRLSYASILSKG